MIRLIQKKKVARRYAEAFLHTFTPSKEQLFEELDSLRNAYTKNSFFFNVLQFSSIRMEDKIRFIKQFCKKNNLSTPYYHLLTVLTQHKQLDIVEFVIKAIKQEFKKQNNMEDVIISTSHSLKPEEKETLEAALQKQITAKLTFFYRQDEALISGIKIQSDAYYWESSIAKRLRHIQRYLNKQEPT